MENETKPVVPDQRAINLSIMERRILIAFALNQTVRMSAAELMTCAAVDSRNYERLVFRDAVNRLARNGILRPFAYVSHNVRVPGLEVAKAQTLPYEEADTMRRHFKPRLINRPPGFPRTVVDLRYFRA